MIHLSFRISSNRDHHGSSANTQVKYFLSLLVFLSTRISTVGTTHICSEQKEKGDYAIAYARQQGGRKEKRKKKEDD